MLNLDPSKLLVIAGVAVIVLGPNKLPDFARQVGAAWRTLAAFRARMESEVRSSIPDLPSTTDLAGYVRSPTALLDRLASPAPESDPDSSAPALVTNLPTIGSPERPHWTTASYDDAPDSRVEAQDDTKSPAAGDAALN